MGVTNARGALVGGLAVRVHDCGKLRAAFSMTYASCPTAVVDAPIDVVWRLLTEPAGWGDFYDVRITEMVPPGPAVVGQRIFGESGPRLLRFRLEHFQEKWEPVFRPKMRPRHSVSVETECALKFEYVEIDAARHRLVFTVRMPFGIFVREDLDCVPLSPTQCRVNYHCNFDLPAGWRGALVWLLLRRELDTGPVDSISRLKQAAERRYELRCS